MGSCQIVEVPRDIEADVLIGLAQYGVRASTLVPANITAGCVRVSRLGGNLAPSGCRDHPKVLVEAWGSDSVAAFDLITPVWAVFRAFKDRGFIHDQAPLAWLELTPARSLDDQQTPELYRMQFVAEMGTELMDMTVQSIH